MSLFPNCLAHPGCSSCPSHQHWHMPRWSRDGWPLRLREPCWGSLLLLLPIEMQDLPLSSRMYPLAQEHTTELCSSLQKWSQSPLSRLQNFRVPMRQAYWLSGQIGETEAAAGWEEGQQHQGDNTNQSGPQRTIGQKQRARVRRPMQIGWSQCKKDGLPRPGWRGMGTMPLHMLFSLPQCLLSLYGGNHGIHSGGEMSVCQVLGTRLPEGP